MKVVVIVAGTNDPSNCDVLVDKFIEGADVDASKVHLKDLNIDHFDLSYYESGRDQGEDFGRIQRLIEQSHGIVIAAPVWNFGVPAHLKNLIDRMGSFALDAETRSKPQLKGKPFFLIFTGGAPLPAWKGMMQKTTSYVAEGLKYFGGSYIGNHFEGKCTVGRGKFGLVVDKRPESLEAVRRKGFEFAKAVAEFERTGKAPVTHRARSRIMRLGEVMLKRFS